MTIRFFVDLHRNKFTNMCKNTEMVIGIHPATATSTNNSSAVSIDNHNNWPISRNSLQQIMISYLKFN